MILDYNLLLVICLILLFASNFLVLLSPGEGLLFLQADTIYVQVPSWRAAFGGRLMVPINPLRVLQPTARLSLFAVDASLDFALLDVAAARFVALSSYAGRLAVFASLWLVISLPVAILLHRNVGFVLLVVVLAYGSFLATLFMGWRQSRKAPLAKGIVSAAMEALCCLPYAAQLPRRASLLMLPHVSLMSLLSSERAIDGSALTALAARIQEYKDVVDDETQQATLATLSTLLASRQSKDATT